jgi:uncharacterized membrane protein
MRQLRVSNHWHHHARFYVALAVAALATGAALALDWPVPSLIGGDVFFAAYLLGTGLLASQLSREELDRRADIEDEGVFVVFLLTITGIVFACVGVFAVLNRQGATALTPLIVTLIGAPLGWFMLHTVMTFHYANIFYAGSASDRKKNRALEFPGGEEPCVLDFFYFSFVIGMTAQVSDVQVRTTRMRRATLAHAIVSFFFNTVLIAMAINGVVANTG